MASNNDYYAVLDSKSIVTHAVRTTKPTKKMIPCTKKIIRENGGVYLGRLPRAGFRYDKDSDVFVMG